MTWPWTRRRSASLPVTTRPAPKAFLAAAAAGTPNVATDLFTFLEADLTGARVAAKPMNGDEMAGRARELANGDWTEHEAAIELARIAAGNHYCLVQAHRQLQWQLLCNRHLDIAGIRATRIVLAAMGREES